ncbi:MAG TPA: cell division protein FtsZ [Ktedonobacteraceae bacterium]|nr:cell division protein FtsZ [Ktedonobacteraceae bacterium]
MQPKFQHDANERPSPPQVGPGMAHYSSNYQQDQIDQWAVLRHEVEDEKVMRNDERAGSARSDWDQRDTEDDSPAVQNPYDLLAQAPNHVNIVVAGVGGGGMNAVNRMIVARVRGVRFVAMNTDAQVLDISEASTRICLGRHYTKGLGAGGNASVGARAAAESAEEVQAALGNADLVFIAAGMGGGTGTGGAPVVASLAKKLGALTIGIVTLPFSFEGSRRKRVAEEGLIALGAEVDALITVPNDRLLAVTGRDRSLADAFKLADDVLRQGVQGIAEVINVPGLVNVDFADVRSVLREAGTAVMSIGQGQGRNRAQRAAEEAIAGGFLNVAIRGAQRVLFNISGGEDMTLFEVNEVAEFIGNAIDHTADITFGAVIDPALDDVIRVTLIAAGMQEARTAHIPAIHLEQQRAQSAFAAPDPAPGAHIPAPSRPSMARPADTMPPAVPPRMPAPPVPGAQPLEAPLTAAPRPVRPAGPQARPQRSLEDLRGLRSMGRRQGQDDQRSQRRTDEEGEAESVDIPPFMKKYQ